MEKEYLTEEYFEALATRACGMIELPNGKFKKVY